MPPEIISNFSAKPFCNIFAKSLQNQYISKFICLAPRASHNCTTMDVYFHQYTGEMRTWRKRIRDAGVV